MQLQFDEVIGLWLEGQRRLAQADPEERPALERVTDAIVQELRRRLGGPFTANELVRLYIEQGIDWCFDVAIRVAPNTPDGLGPDDGRRGGVRPVRARGQRLRRRPADHPGRAATAAQATTERRPADHRRTSSDGGPADDLERRRPRTLVGLVWPSDSSTRRRA